MHIVSFCSYELQGANSGGRATSINAADAGSMYTRALRLLQVEEEYEEDTRSHATDGVGGGAHCYGHTCRRSCFVLFCAKSIKQNQKKMRRTNQRPMVLVEGRTAKAVGGGAVTTGSLATPEIETATMVLSSRTKTTILA